MRSLSRILRLWLGRCLAPALAAGALLPAGCLSAPPTTTTDDTADGGAEAAIALAGLAARDPLTLNGRDDLVLFGLSGSDPVAFLLFDSDGGLAAESVMAVRLPFAPADAVITRWGTLSGIAVMTGPDGELAAILGDGKVVSLALGGVDSPQPQRVTELGSGDDHRLVLIDGTSLMVSDLLGTGRPGEAPVPVSAVGAGGATLALGAADDSGAQAIGLIRAGSRDLDVFSLTSDPLAIGDDLAGTTSVPDGLGRPVWRLFSGAMVLAALDTGGRDLWVSAVPLDGGLASSMTLLDGVFDEIADLMVTRLDGALPDLAVAGRVATGLQLDVHVDPDPASPELPAPLSAPLTDLEPPFWLQGMDAAGPDGGANEVIAYDHRGHVTCLRVTPDALEACGALDLAAIRIP